MLRTHTVSELLSVEPGTAVKLAGWVHRRRDHGPIIFIDLRNRAELVQVVLRLKDFSEDQQKLIKESVRSESVVSIEGTVQLRKAGSDNPDLATGKIEILATAVDVINAAETPPFVLDDPKAVAGEEIRLTYRYLDLRREPMQRILALRHRVMQEIRTFLWQRDFLEIETPVLSKATPEGARDYLVPSRLYPGFFYALPQSPQQYKQLLMVAGVERYMQIVRCFRDEDTRGDRQPEFTQLDLELSFVEQEDVLQLIEELIVHVVKTVTPQKHFTALPFPRLTYKEAMEKYGNDKPDLRKDPNDPNELAFVFVLDFPMFERKDDGSLGAVHHPFTKPRVSSAEELLAIGDPTTVLADQYDLALNGYEIAGGSIRTHDPALLSAVFQVLGHSSEEVQEKFGHLLKAFTYGVPPHGGIASGLDRLIMILAGGSSIRDVIPFPKTGDAKDLMMNAPAGVSLEQLQEVHIRIVKK